MKAEQLTLSVQLPDDETFDSFHAFDNAPVIEQLKGFFTHQNAEFNSTGCFYLFGVSGVGKSHLLHACCSYASEQSISSLCLDFSDKHELSEEVLDGLEHIDLICLDNLHLIAGHSLWEQGVFDLFNRLMEQNKKIIITAQDSAANIGICLPDLVSRLTWGYTEQIKALGDDEKVIALQYRASQRGLTLQHDVAKFLMNRFSRNMKDLIDSLDILDKASIKEQRKITIPFIKNILLP